MKRMLIFLTLVSTLVFESDELVQKLNGVFRQTKNKYGAMTTWKTRDSVTVIKVFRDGYWFGAFYYNKRQRRYDERNTGPMSFKGACGGTYELKNGKYAEKVGFYSWDSTAVGSDFLFDYKISPEQYEQFGFMNSEQYKNYPINEVCERITTTEPLKNKAWEGIWFMKEGYWGGQSRSGEGNYKDFEVVKIFSYPMVVYAYYNPTTKQFDGAGGAMYQFDGKVLTKTNEFWSWQADGKRKGNAEKFKLSVQSGQFVQEGWSGKLREV